MKAINLVPGTKSVSLEEISEPQITAGDEVKIKVWEVGICGTDREETSGGRATAPAGQKKLVIGHEMFGQVEMVGKMVKKVKPGDFGVFMVRRGCGQCAACQNRRSDICYTGNYTERGIHGADGFQAEYVVDKEEYLVKVPEKIRHIGVLTEPMSVAAKAIDEALCLQKARLKEIMDQEKWLKGKKALVAGIGAIGLLAAFILRLKGAEVIGLDIVPEDSLRPQLLKQIGGTYINGKETKTLAIDKEIGQIDFIFEATGIAELQLQLLEALGINGIYVATGIPEGKRPVTNISADVMKQLVLKNQILLGSVNAGYAHYEMAVEMLEQSYRKWPDVVNKLLTARIPFTDFKTALHQHDENEIKVVIEWHKAKA
ncbi:glucose 1-dehydrogenase [Adhaeribacter sp. BT258]|uniref:Glucose 1-dehydrogenase n=1 Tax=Adhaeribacter terrigena TaxID=2793070 RepID=A0ABS1BZY0_9BACT|nr:glucose 1-dehydrogenase [Adhaeribacter terrigena]MBK0402644.1 glucose 1-dehydrogenase [Adhaeribacter terrigena]